MDFTHLLAIVDDEPVFATDLLLAGVMDDVRPLLDVDADLTLLTLANVLQVVMHPRSRT